jgi:GH15 family glucan-1,4-alpha-glucosidase
MTTQGTNARYPDISDHGLIGDLQTAALVTSDGTIDFFCCPRFDSPSIFASLLDHDNGGYFRVSPAGGNYVSKQLYFPDTAMLITRFMTPDGVGEVLDFMPVIQDDAPTDRHRLVRYLRVARGTMQFVVEIQPRFNYGRTGHTVDLSPDGAVFRTADGMELTLHIAGERGTAQDGRVEPAGDGLRATFTMREGDSGLGVVLESMGGQPQRLQRAEFERLANDTAMYWKAWLARSTYTGRWREMVSRSAMTLKLLTYHPSGAPVAAATFGLPEQAGGERNWDYRFTWIRDGSLSMHALANLGYLEEAGRFGAWIRDRAVQDAAAANGTSPLKIMYRVDGSSGLTEETLDHFEGWRGSRPVRIGNGAEDQLQLDIYGEAMETIFTGDDYGMPIAHKGWQALTRIVDWVAGNWDQPDAGVWETRGGNKNFTYGRFQCWIALDRAIKLAGRHGWPADVTTWAVERDRIYNQIMDRGWNDKVSAFTQHYDTEVLDSILLFMPLEGFIAPTDPMWLSTLKGMDRELVSDSLVYRYNPAASPDGLHGSEGTFSLCTFLYVDALARAGRLDDAVLTFEKMFTYGNHLGLYSEEIDSTGGQLGNFPQAFTHLALINAAVTLNSELDKRERKVEPALAAATAR